MAPPGSRRWAYVRIMADTILGGGLGFYVMHRIETSYKVRREERLRRYEAHLLTKEKEAQQLQDEGCREDQAQLLSDS
ncbi:uncharacterized protein LOC123431315 [Hordeum vulgare subsp. vulgare]|uniref:uncharacterized protein LOC123431310 n=1 Tax=Hordeum vulgare subsp. vulgare TaxID=112509 RepID=UPI001D1A3A15|nr:uncharacterized protein LOC123431310 [Hordeum vulgare subsp. vulgare]XP_044971069.1 uncharacterized protein LOC123431312 [Hordeum vulgare subsp. vulgare]XP_044971071.1 uncharacterized protein LOC123431315 [Hordeum vulgare subsp. vulgare]